MNEREFETTISPFLGRSLVNGPLAEVNGPLPFCQKLDDKLDIQMPVLCFIFSLMYLRPKLINLSKKSEKEKMLSYFLFVIS